MNDYDPESEVLTTLIARLGNEMEANRKLRAQVDELQANSTREVMARREKLGLNEMCRRAHSMAVEKQWYDRERGVPELIALAHSELSEALECFRDGDMTTTIEESGKPTGFPTEIADVVIRCGDICGHLGIDLEEAVKVKMAFNATRPARHGGKAA